MFFVPFWVKKLIERVVKDVFSIKRRKRIAVSDIFLNFAFAILVGCMGDDIVSCLFIYIIRYRR